MLEWAIIEEVRSMPQKLYASEEIIRYHRIVELETGKGVPVLDDCHKVREHRTNLLSLEEVI
jgi:hypothetical protein